MSVLDWFARPAVGENIVNAGDAWWWTGGVRQLASKIKVDQQSALNYSAVWAATRAVSETLASLPAVVYERTSENSRQRAKGAWLYRMLHDEPNPEMDAFTFYELQTTRLVNQGNAFAEVERNQQGEPLALWPIHNSRVRAWRLPSEYRAGRYFPGKLEYHIAADTGGYYVIPQRDMLNVVGTNSHDGILASGVIPRASESIGLGIATERYGASFFGSGARPPGVLEHPGHINDPNVRSNIRREWNDVHAGEGNWQNIAVLWEGMKYKEVGIAPEQAQFIATRRFNITVLAQWYGVSPAMLQDYSDSKFATVEAQLKHFIMLSIRPWAVRWERAINRQVIGIESDFFVEFVMNALLRGDPKTQAETNQIKFLHGALSDDEWRAQDNDNPLPYGKGSHYYVPKNVVRIEDVVSGWPEDGEDDSRQEVDAAEQGEETPAAGERVFQVRTEALACKLIEEAGDRMRRQEIAAIEHAARKDPTRFLTAIDAFYDRFENRLAEAIRPGVECWLLAQDADVVSPDPLAAMLAERHVAESRRQLLEVSECQPGELVDHVLTALSVWPSRTFEIEQLKKAA